MRRAEGHAIGKKKINRSVIKLHLQSFQTNQPTHVIKSMPRGTKELARQTMSLRQKKEITQLRAQVVAKAPGGIRVMVLVI